MQVGLLGPLEVRVGGVPVRVAGARLGRLLTRLALDAGRPVSAAALTDAVWGAALPSDEANALQSLVSRLRRTLGDAQAVQPLGAGYRLDAEPDDVDVHRFERLAAAGAAAMRDADPVGAERLFREALALWRGPALADCADAEFAAAPIAGLEDLRLAAVTDRLQAQIALGRIPPAVAVAQLEALAREHPLDERLLATLMTALRAMGRPSDALAAYERTRNRLAEELGVDPSPELRELHVSILRGDPAEARIAPTPGRRTNLRAALTSFVGRDEEAARIGKLLDESRLVTLVGPGGAGKTRLATEAAAGQLSDAWDGIWFVELAPVTDPTEVVYAVLASIGRRDATTLSDPHAPRRPSEALDELIEALESRRVLLVVDNCEHLLGPVAELLDTLLAACPVLSALATSREPLAITGEALVVLAPLHVPPADATVEQALASASVQLFADRAAAARPGLAVDDGTVADVVQIVRRLDGLPLAIELAAARLRTLPITEIAARLSDRFRLLTGGSRTALPRHRTLRAVVEWSWELLTPPERLLAERLAVFPAGATLTSATAVTVGGAVHESDVADLLAALVDKSLLVLEDTGPRYRMLETIREFGIDRLAERGEVDEVRDAHARHFATVAARTAVELRDHRQQQALAVLAAEHDNILAALRHLCAAGEAPAAVRLVVDLNQYWAVTGRHAEAVTWLDLALALRMDDVDQDLRVVAGALRAVNAMANAQVREVEGIDMRSVIIPLLPELLTVDAIELPIAAIMKPLLLWFGNDVERLPEYIQQAVDHPDPWVRATALTLRARFAENQGDMQQVRVDVEAAIAEYEAVGNDHGLASVLPLAASLCVYDGDMAEALRLLTRAYELTAGEEAGLDLDDRLFVLLRLADLHARQRDLAQSWHYAVLADEQAQATGSPEWMALTAALRGGLKRAAGDRRAALELQEEAERQLARASHTRFAVDHGRAIIGASRASLQVEAGDLDAAAATVRDAYAAARSALDMPIVAIVAVAGAELAAAAGDPAEAAFLLGLAARLRGAEDPTALSVAPVAAAARAELGDDGYSERWSSGWEVSTAEALDLADPDRWWVQARRR